MPSLLSPTALAAIASHQRTVTSLYQVSIVILVYDHFLTLASEISSIWFAPWSIPKVLFFINRYYSVIAYSLFNVTSFTVESTSSVIYLCVVTLSELFLVPPWLSPHPDNNRYHDLASICFMRSELPSASPLWDFIDNGDRTVVSECFFVTATLPPGFLGCLPDPTVRFQWVYFAFPIIIDGLVFLITLWKTRGHRSWTLGGRSMIIERFRKDGILYFMCIVTVNFINLMFSTASDGKLNGTASSLATLFTSVMVSRLALGLRTHGNQDRAAASGTLGWSLGTIIEFNFNNTNIRVSEESIGRNVTPRPTPIFAES
ncbi:hypothetical protein M422DRAFT_261655 [Sphaerobolus stellatus SS14]|uniref:DUF6533 domain-containing protein n=1 Tax=Sphaerobolus stellatus (strain SS14) TaxID=990650 RepID=A0A0C9V300_SPHS4|nr:hypothetical protein M422DRAFT_261655 [Sphaerobolus stellatus SS14]